MYITINDIIGGARIDLSYPIHPRKEIAVVSMLSDNVQYWLQMSIEVLSIMGKKIVLNRGVYMGKELDSLIGAKMKSRMDDCDDVLRTSKLYNGTKFFHQLERIR